MKSVDRPAFATAVTKIRCNEPGALVSFRRKDNSVVTTVGMLDCGGDWKPPMPLASDVWSISVDDPHEIVDIGFEKNPPAVLDTGRVFH